MGCACSRSFSRAPTFGYHRTWCTRRVPCRAEAFRQISDYAETVVLKDGRSAERLVNEVQRFVGRVRGNLQRRDLEDTESQSLLDAALAGTTILIADDDMRTVYALSALLRGKART